MDHARNSHSNFRHFWEGYYLPGLRTACGGGGGGETGQSIHKAEGSKAVYLPPSFDATIVKGHCSVVVSKMAMEMDTASSAGERLLDPEQYEHEEKGEGLSVSHKRRGAFMSVVMGQFLQQRLSWRFILRLKSLVPSFALASTRKQHAVVHSQLKDTSYMDGLRLVL